MKCRYCGLETGSGAGHRSQAECIRALSDEIDRAKRLIGSVREAPPSPSVEAPHAMSAGQHGANH